jgi:ABC-type transport system involved in multi-copper enzyme maturation permease subunit
MVFRNLLAKEFRQLRWVIIIGLILNVGLAFLLTLTYRFLGQFLGEIPQDVFDILSSYNLIRQLFEITGNYSFYIWSQWNAKNLFQLGSILVIIIAATQFAGEGSKKTMGFYLTRPISRFQGFLAKTSAAVLIIVLLFLSGLFLMWLISTILGYSAAWGRLFIATLIGIAWLMVYYLIALIISIKSSEPIPAGVTAGIVGIILSIPGLFTAVRQLSIFYQMRAVEYFINGHSFLFSFVSALLIGSLLFYLGFYIFKQRDY